MRVPLSWLKDFVEISLPVAEVDSLLTNAGLEVKSTDYFGVPGADLVWDREKIVVGHVLKVEPHPNADRLVLATVAYGTDEPEIVVTGAPNLFPYLEQGDISQSNLYSPFALEGAVLYDGHKEGRQQMRLKGRSLRGIYNRAMLCSEKELGISQEHEGVILMQQDEWSPAYQAGAPLQDLMGDTVLDIDIIPNIARCASMLGVARELAALTSRPLRYPDFEVVMEGPPLAGKLALSTESPELNPRFVALVIAGVAQHDSPYWLQYRLKLAGQRPINVVVDISNYVMLEMGQPNHAFDYDVLAARARQYDPGGPIHLITRLAQEGERLKTLDGVEHALRPYNILVTDPLGNLSLGGIMGGANSEIRPDTTTVLLEAAAWNFINIRRSADRLGIHSDAAFRFSRGVHPSQAILGAKRAAELMRRLAGGTVAEGIVDNYPAPPEPAVVELRPSYVRQLSGLDIKSEEISDYLQRLEFDVEPYGDHLLVTTPDHRLDIEGAHDLVEEVCRLAGYNKIPSTLIADSLPPQRGNVELEREERVRDVLVTMGLQEIITYRLTSAEKEARLYPQVGSDERPYITLTNPLSADRNVMRHSVLASALEIAADNSRFQNRIALFEIGQIYLPASASLLPDEPRRLAIVMTGLRAATHWQADAGALPTLGFYDLKGVLAGLFGRLHLDVTFETGSHPSYHPGRVARLLLGMTRVGSMGRLHPLVVEAFGLRLAHPDQPVLAAELDLELMLPKLADSHDFESIAPYPPVREDLALLVDVDLPAAEVDSAMRQAGGFLLKEVELFDVYTGQQIPAGKKSLAYHLTFQSPDKTLSDREIHKSRQRILQQLESRLGARLRE